MNSLTIRETKVLAKQVFPLHTDVMGKHIFGFQGRARFIQSLLEATFKVPKGTYDGLKIINSVLLDKDNIFSKDLEMDILVELPTNELICIEMYSKYDNSAETKSFMYITRSFSHTLKKGKEYKVTRPISQLNFVKSDNVHDNLNNELVRKYLVINENNPKDRILADLFQIYVVDVDITRKIGYDFDDEFERWMAFIAAETREEMELIVRGHEIMEEVFDEMEKFSSEEWVASGLFNRDRLIRSQAKEEGISQGIEQNKKEIAKSMLNKNFDIKDILEVTGLTEEELNELK